MVGITQRAPTVELLHQLEHRMSRMYNDPFRAFEWPVPEAATTAWQPLGDIFEGPDSIRLVAEGPGVQPEAVTISDAAYRLTTKGQKEQAATERAEKVKRADSTRGDLELP